MTRLLESFHAAALGEGRESRIPAACSADCGCWDREHDTVALPVDGQTCR
jgi:hypothetical protein